MQQTEDRRRETRVALDLPAVLSTNSSTKPSREVKAQTVNLSLKGCAVVCGNSIPHDAECVVRLGSILNPEINHEYPARNIWVSPDSHQVGLEFSSIPGPLAAELSKVLELAKWIKRDRFSINMTVFLKDTNAEGNVYFARYFDWQGMAREAFFRQLLGESVAVFTSGQLRLITVDAAIHFRHELRLFDEVVIRVQPTNTRHTSVDLLFSYLKTNGEEIATGKQTIAFASPSGSLIPIPRQVLEAGRTYLNDIEQLRLLYYLEKPEHQSAAR